MRLFVGAAVIFASLVGTCAAANILTVTRYKSPVNRIQGKVVKPNGDPIDLADVTVFSNPEVWSDDSLSMVQKRAKQRRVAATGTDDDGKFSLKRLAKGSYELHFSRDGFNDFSVIVQVDHSAQSQKFCVQLSISDAGGEPSFRPCASQSHLPSSR